MGRRRRPALAREGDERLSGTPCVHGYSAGMLIGQGNALGDCGVGRPRTCEKRPYLGAATA
jgi:hypothetical protein